MNSRLFAGKQVLSVQLGEIRGEPVLLEGESFYKIENYDRMRPFFMTVPSDSDLWMFISSTGALTAGRCNPDHAAFPYCTDDKIHDSAEITGPRTGVVLEANGRRMLWSPFSRCGAGAYKIKRSLYKSFFGNKLIFEEINESLGLKFSYGWFNSARFGFIRKSWLENLTGGSVSIVILDGFQNILPSGIGSQFQLEKSTLLDAYKRNELVEEAGLALFTLSSIPVDRPEPAESLSATTAWSVGINRPRIILSSLDTEGFFRGEQLVQRKDIRGERGAYFLHKRMRLRSGQAFRWTFGLDVDQSHSDITELIRLLRNPDRLSTMVERDIAQGTRVLRRMVGTADGLQKTALTMGVARHYANVLFNIMRGGVFADETRIDREDLSNFIVQFNKEVGRRSRTFLRGIKPGTSHSDLLSAAMRTGDVHLLRIVLQYLPLVFSRRHGDPSRPWNRFSIAPRANNGKQNLDYEGNWRDIFQNWEALARSFPGYTVSMVAKFLNASTPDGYNPYRISRAGFDWEISDPHDPWSFIGYWGDHQIVYLTKLLEILLAHEPEIVRDLVNRETFSYANVPYRIKDYKSLVRDPRLTVDFDYELQRKILSRVKQMGEDGKSVLDSEGDIKLSNLAEKLLIPVLGKFANFIPEAGIWLNTQRPEWNDANNALVGNGCSMVTLYYLRRHLKLLEQIFASGQDAIEFSFEVAAFFREVCRILSRNAGLLRAHISDKDRERMIGLLGEAGGRYRARIYQQGFSARKASVSKKALIEFLASAVRWIDHSISANRRSDGMFEAYNLARFDASGVSVKPLYLMLEGQVAILSSGYLNGEESLGLLRKLRRSPLYRSDQNSYLLYPDRELPAFQEKNVIREADIRRSALLRTLIRSGNREIVQRDAKGLAHFNKAFRNTDDLKRALTRLAETEHSALVRSEQGLVLQAFENVFRHEFFTGRSGTFFAYEGLGSIYWHMVSKLLLATQETCFRALEAHESAAVLKGLEERYYDIREGIGVTKSPGLYGGFPFDPYSHTPKHKGASQPGLTGQVKEDILCRWGELGVRVSDGKLHFKPFLLRQDEFLATQGTFTYFGVGGAEQRLRHPPNSVVFTMCGVPVVYTLGKSDSLVIRYSDGTRHSSDELSLNKADSRSLFERSGRITRISATLARRA